MRKFYESTRLYAYLVIFRFYATVEFAKRPLAFKRYGLEFLAVSMRWSVFVLALAIFQLIAAIGGILAAIIVDFIWLTAVPAILLLFSVAGFPALDIYSAHVGWKEYEPRNSVPLDLFRFRGKVLFMTDRCLIFSAESRTSFDEVFRVFRILSSIDSSVHVARTDTVVFIYNTSAYASAEEDLEEIQLPIPNRCDIRKRSYLKYSVRVCDENSAHAGLINADTFNKMTRAINDCYNVLDSGIHFSIMNTVKTVLVPLVPAVLVSASFRATKWEFLQWVGDNEIEIFFGLLGAVSLFRVIRQETPIRYERLGHTPERIEHVARVATIRQNDASPNSTAWHTGETFGSVDCQIKNGMEAFMLAFILVHEDEEGQLRAVCIDRLLEFVELTEETEAKKVLEPNRMLLLNTAARETHV